jgi:hypothetical protein
MGTLQYRLGKAIFTARSAPRCRPSQIWGRTQIGSVQLEQSLQAWRRQREKSSDLTAHPPRPPGEAMTENGASPKLGNSGRQSCIVKLTPVAGKRDCMVRQFRRGFASLILV